MSHTALFNFLSHSFPLRLKRWRDILDSVLSTLLQSGITPSVGVSLRAPQLGEFERCGTWRCSCGRRSREQPPGAVDLLAEVGSALAHVPIAFFVGGCWDTAERWKPLRPTLWLSLVLSMHVSVVLRRESLLTGPSHAWNVEQQLSGSGCDVSWSVQRADHGDRGWRKGGEVMFGRRHGTCMLYP